MARDRAALEAVAASVGRERALVVSADLVDLTAVREAVEATLDRYGRIDVLVNNAGVLSAHDFLETSVEQIARTVDVNFRATAVLTRLVAAEMAARGTGHIVTIASFAGVTGVPGEPVYAGSKAALRLFTSSLRPELGRYGIRLTDVVLGTAPSDMLDEIESNPGVRRTFNRFRRIGMLVDTPAVAVGVAVARGIERNEAVVVLPARGRYLALPLQGVSRAIANLLSR